MCLGPEGPRYYPLSSFARWEIKNDADPHEVISLSFFFVPQRACERRAFRFNFYWVIVLSLVCVMFTFSLSLVVVAMLMLSVQPLLQ